MLAMITTEEYKELINAQQDGEVFMMQLEQATRELREYKEKLEGLLNCITNGENPKWDEQYRSYELADNLVLTDYINKNFVKDGILTVKGNDND